MKFSAGGVRYDKTMNTQTKQLQEIEGPAGIEPDEFKEREVNDETGEPVKLTAKEMIKANKKLFGELLGLA